jgi:hypothetical protein
VEVRRVRAEQRLDLGEEIDRGALGKVAATLGGDTRERPEMSRDRAAAAVLRAAQFGHRVAQEGREQRPPRQLEAQVLATLEHQHEEAAPAGAEGQGQRHIGRDQREEHMDQLDALLVEQRDLQPDQTPEGRAVEPCAALEVSRS